MFAVTEDDLPIEASPSFIKLAFVRICSELSADAKEWSTVVTGLRRFQDTELLDNPTPEKLKAHKRIITMMIAFGEFISNATKDPSFPDRETHEMVTATIQILRDDLALWRSNLLTSEQSNKILADCFPA
jgi:hypothetical protein